MCHLRTFSHNPPPQPVPLLRVTIFILQKHSFIKTFLGEIEFKNGQKGHVTVWLTPFLPMCHLVTLSRTLALSKCHVVFEWPLTKRETAELFFFGSYNAGDFDAIIAPNSMLREFDAKTNHSFVSFKSLVELRGCFETLTIKNE